MKMLENLYTNDKIIYSDGHCSDCYNQKLYLKKSVDDGSGKSKFYISVYTNIDGIEIQQGYLYFYLDYNRKMSTFIGLAVHEEYRNRGIGTFLIASWIDLCLSNGYDFLDTHKKQKKPFLLYLLKTYGFDVIDKSLYDTRSDVITICRDRDFTDKSKLLLFKDSFHERVFARMNVYKCDNYVIIHDDVNIIKLDNVIVPIQSVNRDFVKYSLIDSETAYKKTQLILSRHKR